jgi:NADH:ubiquinone oxidoreductase subunit 5 (subunit L)/multisubunit Na+/H+ antiporter MnhA subunit
MLSLIVFLPLFSSICVGFQGFRIGTKGAAVLTSFSLLSTAFLSYWAL